MGVYKATLSRNYRDKKRVYCTEYLRCHPCVDCRETDIRVLDFDHVDPLTKSRNVSRMVASGHWNWARCLEEIQKCVVRCSNCHRRKTIGEPEWFLDPVGFKAKVVARDVKKEEAAIVRCGTRRSYQRGCHCTLCKKAQTDYMRDLRAKTRQRNAGLV